MFGWTEMGDFSMFCLEFQMSERVNRKKQRIQIYSFAPKKGRTGEMDDKNRVLEGTQKERNERNLSM